jgi:catechol 2,3-dioxygenase-like lactoylglutathione lyase family enzyme
MNNLYARSVFFVADAERAVRFYTERLGFAEDWNYREGDHRFVCQVSLLGFELILNEVDNRTRARAGHGRVFIGLEEDQGEPFRRHLATRTVPMDRVDWGRPTLLIRDVDNNEIFFWLPGDDFTGFDTGAASAGV